MMAKSVFLLSTHGLFREAIEQLINSPGLTIVGKDTDLAGILKEADSGKRPDLVISILDPDQSPAGELESLKELHGSFDGMKTILLMPPEQQVALCAAVQSGVDAILTTRVSGAALRHVIELVFLGQRILMPEVVSSQDNGSIPVSESLSTCIALPLLAPSLASGSKPVLSMREQEILRSLVNGYSNKVIARELAITEATVKVHMKALLRKIQTANRTQAAIWAVNNGFATQNQHQWINGTSPSGRPKIMTHTDSPVHDCQLAE